MSDGCYETMGGSVDASLVFDVLATHPLDFRTARILCLVCKASRRAISFGPCTFITDTDNVITHADLDNLFWLLRWMGTAVRSVILDQQPNSLWAKDIETYHLCECFERMADDDESSRADVRCSMISNLTKSMPSPRATTLQRIRRYCPTLEVLSLHNWHAFNGDPDPGWTHSVVSELQHLKNLRVLHAPGPSRYEHVDFMPLLERTKLTQLSISLWSDHSTRIIHSSHASRLLQLDLIEASIGRQLHDLGGKCANLRRLRLKWCDLCGVELTKALPPSLRILEIHEPVLKRDPHEQLLPEPIASLRTHFANLQLFELVYPIGMGPSPPHLVPSAHYAHALFASPDLRALNLTNVGTLCDDALLAQVSKTCHRLHTLHLPGTNVSAAGLRTLIMVEDDAPAAAQLLLPRLRVLSYTNEHYSASIDLFYEMSLAELRQEKLEHLQAHPSVGEDIERFFTFCEVVVTRGLAVPLEAQSWDVLPSQAHPLVRDYLHLGVG